MADLKLKKFNGTSWEDAYPETTVGQIVAGGTPNSTTFLRGDGQWAVLDTTDDYVNSGSFNTATGVITLTGIGSAGATIDIDGRYVEGTWNSVYGTYDVVLTASTTLQLGQEQHMYGKATEAIGNGQAVMFDGVQGDHVLFAKADPDTLASNPEYYIGIATQDFALNDFGYVTTFGNVNGIDTGGLGYTAGDILYVNTASGATAGTLTTTKPNASRSIIEAAAVLKEETGGSNNGILLARRTLISRSISEVNGLQTALDSKVDLAGDTMTGDLTVETDVNVEQDLNLGSTQQATIRYNSSDNSIDFIIN